MDINNQDTIDKKSSSTGIVIAIALVILIGLGVWYTLGKSRNDVAVDAPDNGSLEEGNKNFVGSETNVSDTEVEADVLGENQFTDLPPFEVGEK